MNQTHAEVLTVIRRSEAEETATRAIGNEGFSSIGYILIYGEAEEVYKGPIERRTVNKPGEPKRLSSSQLFTGG